MVWKVVTSLACGYLRPHTPIWWGLPTLDGAMVPSSVSKSLPAVVSGIHHYWFFFFWLHWVFVAARGLSLVVASGGYSSLWCVGFSLRWLLLLWSTGSRHVRFSGCSTGLVAPRHVGSSQRTRDRTHAPCIGRRILNHWKLQEHC